MIENISPVLIVKDGALTIARCLSSLVNFAEVVVYLNNTTDATREICAKFPNVKLVEGQFTTYSETRNQAAMHSQNDWIYYIDVDEWLDDTLVSALKKIELNDDQLVGMNLIIEHFKGKRIRRGWLRPHYRPSLYNKQKRSFQHIIYEAISLESAKLVKLPGHKFHSGFENMPAVFAKMQNYGQLHALSGKKRRSKPIAFAGMVFSFLRSLLIQGGIIDGTAGVQIAYLCALFHWHRYTKRKPEAPR